MSFEGDGSVQQFLDEHNHLLFVNGSWLVLIELDKKFIKGLFRQRLLWVEVLHGLYHKFLSFFLVKIAWAVLVKLIPDLVDYVFNIAFHVNCLRSEDFLLLYKFLPENILDELPNHDLVASDKLHIHLAFYVFLLRWVAHLSVLRFLKPLEQILNVVGDRGVDSEVALEHVYFLFESELTSGQVNIRPLLFDNPIDSFDHHIYPPVLNLLFRKIHHIVDECLFLKFGRRYHISSWFLYFDLFLSYAFVERECFSQSSLFLQLFIIIFDPGKHLAKSCHLLAVYFQFCVLH